MDKESKWAASAGADGAVLSVLVVEDDAAVRRLIATALVMHGYHVEVAATGEAAILEAASHGADLVLLDLGLPDVDGIAVIKKQRSIRERTTISRSRFPWKSFSLACVPGSDVLACRSVTTRARACSRTVLCAWTMRRDARI